MLDLEDLTEDDFVKKRSASANLPLQLLGNLSIGFCAFILLLALLEYHFVL